MSVVVDVVLDGDVVDVTVLNRDAVKVVVRVLERDAVEVIVRVFERDVMNLLVPEEVAVLV